MNAIFGTPNGVISFTLIMLTIIMINTLDFERVA